MRAIASGILLFLIVFVAPFDAQGPDPQIWSGVFSPDQAERGRAIVAGQCTQCHNQNRPLNDAVFMLHWEGHSLARLFRKIRDTMPPGRTDDLSDRDRLDIVAFVLQQNGFPTGEQELAQDDALLEGLRILPRGGPRPMRSGAVVEVEGCLTEVSAFRWRITNATEPMPAALRKPTTLSQRPTRLCRPGISRST
jgi:quinoprotein glucose dehydrogenase